MQKTNTPYFNDNQHENKYNFKKSKKKIYLNIVDSLDNSPSDTDPLGMYTGVPQDKYDVPIQDADDL